MVYGIWYLVAYAWLSSCSAVLESAIAIDLRVIRNALCHDNPLVESDILLLECFSIFWVSIKANAQIARLDRTF